MKKKFLFLFYFQLLTETKNEDVVIEVIKESEKLYFCFPACFTPSSFSLQTAFFENYTYTTAVAFLE